LVLAVDEDGKLHRVVLDSAVDELSLQRIALYDAGHSLCRLTFDRFVVAPFAIYPATAEDQTLAHAATGFAAEAQGGAEALLQLTIDYLKTRQQFGKPIGAFQALKHRVADHRTRIEAGRVLLRAAVAGLAAGVPQAHADAAAAKALICADYVALARDAIQLHGGIGYTQEHACHLFAKRAWLLDALLGGRSASAERAYALALEGAA
ncbi:MAG: hypothetical protein KGL21_10210, partial [Alphaproteobacteria bacterium]|nr:hypothetical protein [Alphaproteobacteria bacterium]